MKKRKNRIFIVLVLTLIVGLFSPLQAAAQDNDTSQDGKTELTEELAIEIAEGFANGIESTSDIEAVNPVKFYNLDGQAIGYIVDFSKNNVPYGYVILDSTNEELICEYSLGEEAVSPDKVAKENNGIVSAYSTEDEDNKVYRVNPFTYGVEKNNEIVTNNSEEEYSIPQTRSIPTESWNDIFIDNYYTNYDHIEENYHSTFYSITEDYVEAVTGHYACAVSALAMCADFYGLLNYREFEDEYMRLWDYTNTTVDHTSGDITYGSTYDANSISGFKKFCSEKGRYFSADMYTVNIYSGFKKCIDSGNVGVIAATIYDHGERSGHMMSLQGYSLLQPKGTSTRIETVRVADGWGANPRYINLTQVEWIMVTGYGFHA